MISGFIGGKYFAIFCGAFGGALASRIVNYLHTHVRRIALKDASGLRTVTPSLGYQLLAMFVLAAAALVFYAAHYTSPSQARMAHIVSAFFAITASLVVHEVFVRRVRWNTDYLESQSLLGARRIAWNEVALGGYSVALDMAYIKDNRGRRIWVPPFNGATMLWRYGRYRTRVFSRRPGRAFRR